MSRAVATVAPVAVARAPGTAELTIPGKLQRLIEVHKRFKVILGGRGSAKSNSVGDICLKDVAVTGLKVGCFREYQNTIADSVHSLLAGEIERLGGEGFEVLAQEINHASGGGFRFRGLARNASGVKSMHGFRRFWIEEAQTISKESLKLLTPTMREEEGEIWMTANPQSRADPFSERFINPFLRDLEKYGYYEDDLHLIIVSNYMDNPFFPPELEQERQWDEEHLPWAEYEHIWLGKFLDTVENAIISVEWFNSAIDAHLQLGIEPQGVRILAHDPSDLGPDPKGLMLRHGSVITGCWDNDKGTAEEGMDWATQMAIDERVDVFRWDCDGLGVSLKRQAATQLDGKGIDIDMFKGSEGVDFPNDIYQPDGVIDKRNAKTNKETFKNKRAQWYWNLRDRFMNTHRAVTRKLYMNPESLISISSEHIDPGMIDRLRTEVCRIPRRYNANGYIQIMSKVEMKKPPLNIESPNLADSLMMLMPGHTRNVTVSTQARPVVRRSMSGWT